MVLPHDKAARAVVNESRQVLCPEFRLKNRIKYFFVIAPNKLTLHALPFIANLSDREQM